MLGLTGSASPATNPVVITQGVVDINKRFSLGRLPSRVFDIQMIL